MPSTAPQISVRDQQIDHVVAALVDLSVPVGRIVPRATLAQCVDDLRAQVPAMRAAGADDLADRVAAAAASFGC